MRDHSEVSRSLGAWLDEYMHESLHEVVERDSTVLEVVYRVDIPMLDKDGLYYCEVVLTAVPEARAFHERLDTGKKALVQSTMNRGDRYGNAYGKRTVPRPMVRGECENEIFSYVVSAQQLSTQCDQARSGLRPGQVFKEDQIALKFHFMDNQQRKVLANQCQFQDEKFRVRAIEHKAEVDDHNGQIETQSTASQADHQTLVGYHKASIEHHRPDRHMREQSA
ncbi:hypothetical protein IQ06DRAFT_336659 [Phaeosphaeriaceae sp. SRC1lsM3a]|nr:hypothetical protein IQ06DRAFT_336659 [Stagonospora sp. SRC1lsM3a]